MKWLIVCVVVLSAGCSSDDDALDRVDAGPRPDAWCSPFDPTCSRCGEDGRNCCERETAPSLYCDDGLVCDPVSVNCLKPAGGGDQQQ